jgi:tetratricopeptide (TPR) repeat protein
MFVELARWFRIQQKRDKNFASRNLPEDALNAKPRTQLLLIARSSAGRSFLAEQESELKDALRASRKAESTAELFAQLGSIYHLQGNLQQALKCLQRAVDLDLTSRRCSDVSQYLCKLERVMRQIAAHESVQKCMTHIAPSANVQPVAVRDASDLTVDEFLLNYAQEGVPVIIRGLVNGGIFQNGAWQLDHLAQRLGDKSFVPRRRCALSPDWANLEDCPATSIRSFIHNVQKDEECVGADNAECQPRTSATGYLFDWNLPESAPELCDELRIPAYFASDWLQVLRTVHG